MCGMHQRSTHGTHSKVVTCSSDVFALTCHEASYHKLNREHGALAHDGGVWVRHRQQRVGRDVTRVGKPPCRRLVQHLRTSIAVHAVCV